ncbi:MAG: hypothetical protein V2A79_14240 [Planctomycetota bacterium]
MPVPHRSWPLSPRALGRPRHPRRRSFSLLELVLNTIIIGMLAGIAVPRFSQAAQSAKAKTMAATITRVRNAVEHYYAEHGRYPGYVPGTGAPDGEWFVNQLTRYSDAQGNVSETLAYPFIYGPYLRAPFPKNLLNELNTVRAVATKMTIVPADSTGWKAVLSTGEFTPNSPQSEMDDFGMGEFG